MDDVARAAAIACDPDAPVGARVRALVAVVDAAVTADAALPEVLVDAIDDLALLDAAVAARHASAVCALLHLVGARPELASSRRRAVRRLIAAGVAGIPLAGLAFAIGDPAAGAALAARDYVDHIAPLVDQPVAQPLVDAWLRWLASQDDTAIIAVLRALAARQIDSWAALAHLTNLPAADRLRAITRSMLAT